MADGPVIEMFPESASQVRNLPLTGTGLPLMRGWIPKPGDNALRDERVTADTLVVNTQEARDLVADIQLNPYAADIFPASFIRQITPGMLHSWARMTVPWEVSGPSTRKVLVEAEHGRSLPIGFTREPVIFQPGHAGFRVFGKGMGISGFNYPFSDRAAEPLTDENDPTGFMGRDKALLDMEISNLLLAEGRRVSPTIGYLVLDTDRTARFIEAAWEPGYPEIARVLLRNINRVTASGTDLAVQFRFGGDGSRLQHFRKSTYAKSHHEKTGGAAIIRAARLMTYELSHDTRFPSYLSPAEVELPDALRVLKRIAASSPQAPADRLQAKISEEESLLLYRILAGVIATEAKGFIDFAGRHPEYPGMLYNQLAKDTDFSLLRYDMELADTYQGPEKIRDYIRSSISLLMDYRLELSRLGFMPIRVSDSDRAAIIRGIYESVFETAADPKDFRLV